MVVTKKKLEGRALVQIDVDGKWVGQIDSFQFFGNALNWCGRYGVVVKMRIARQKEDFNDIKVIMTKKNISFNCRKRRPNDILQCYCNVQL